MIGFPRNLPETFEQGDKVRLKKGGPVMTIQVAPDEMAYCVWFVGPKTHQGTFSQDSLELVRRKDEVRDSVFPNLS